MKFGKLFLFVLALPLCAALLGSVATAEQSGPSIFQGTLIEPKQKTPNISTEELRKILAEQKATVFDARPHEEFAISHIPGVVNARTLAVIERIVQGNKAALIVLYCNGPFCGKSKRLAEKLLAAGYTKVRRYQLGMPVWRALGGVTEIELEGVRYVIEKDKTAVLLDARSPDEFKAGTLPDARNLPHAGIKQGAVMSPGGRRKGGGKELKNAKKDGRLPVNDHNTRIIVFGRDGAQAKYVAEVLCKQAFHNTAYFGGTFKTLQSALKDSSYE